MNSEERANIIRTRFKTLVADVLNLQTQYDNQDFENPDNDNWCRLTLKTTETFQVSFGNPQGNRYRTHGVMIAQLFGPLGNGDGKLREIADVIMYAFRGVTDNGVTFRAPSHDEVGIFGDSWQINVVCPFYSDDIG